MKPQLKLNKQSLLQSRSVPGTPRLDNTQTALSSASLPNTPRQASQQNKTIKNRVLADKMVLEDTNKVKEKIKPRITKRRQQKKELFKEKESPFDINQLPLTVRLNVESFKTTFGKMIADQLESICQQYDTKKYTFASDVSDILKMVVSGEQRGGAKAGDVTYQLDQDGLLNAQDIMSVGFKGNTPPEDYKAHAICIGSSPEGLYLCILIKLLIPDLEVLVLKESENDGTRRLADPTMMLIKFLHTFGLDNNILNNEVTKGAMCDETTELRSKLYTESARGEVLNIFPNCFYTSEDVKEYNKIFKIQAENENVPIQINMLEYFLTRRAQELGIMVFHAGSNDSLKDKAKKYMSENTIVLFNALGDLVAQNNNRVSGTETVYYAYGRDRLVPGVKLPKQSAYDNFSGNPYGFYFASKNKLTVDSSIKNIYKTVRSNPVKGKMQWFDMCAKTPVTSASFTDSIAVPFVAVGSSLHKNHVFNSAFGYYGFSDGYIVAMLFKKVYDANKQDPNKVPPPPPHTPIVAKQDASVQPPVLSVMPPPPPPPTKDETPVSLEDISVDIVEPPFEVETRQAQPVEQPIQAKLTITTSESVQTDTKKAEPAPLSVTASEEEQKEAPRTQAILTITATPVTPVEEQKENPLVDETISITALEEEQKEAPRTQANLTITATPVKPVDEQKENPPVDATISVTALEEEQKDAPRTQAILTITATPVTPVDEQKETRPVDATLSITASEEEQKVEPSTLSITAIPVETQTEEQEMSPPLATTTEQKVETLAPLPTETAESKDNTSFFSGMFGCTQGALDQSLSKKLQEERERANMKTGPSENPIADEQQMDNKEEIKTKWNELKEELAGPSNNLGITSFASGLVKGTAGIFSKLSNATTAKLKTVPYEMLNPSVKYLSIYINPGIEFVPKMLYKYSTSNTVQFNPLVRYSERVINTIPEGRPRTDIYDKLFNKQSFKVMLSETMSSLFGTQTKKTIKEAMDAGIVDENIVTTLNTLFATGNVLYINDAPYTVYSYTWNGEWQVDTKVPNSFEHMVHPYQREGLFKYDEMQQAAAQKELANLPKDILMSKKLQSRLEEPEEKEVDTKEETFLDKIVDAIKPTLKPHQVRTIDKGVVPAGVSKAGVRAVNASLRRYKAFMPLSTNKWDSEVDPYTFTLRFTDRDQLQAFVKDPPQKVNGLEEKYAEMDAFRNQHTSLSDDYNNALQQLTENNTELTSQISALSNRLQDVKSSVRPLIEPGLDKLGLRDKIVNKDDLSEFTAFLSVNVSKHVGALIEHYSKMPLYKCDKVGLMNNMFTRVNEVEAMSKLVGKELWEEINKPDAQSDPIMKVLKEDIEQLKSSASKVVEKREEIIAGSRNPNKMLLEQSIYNETFQSIQNSVLLREPLAKMVDAICAVEFQKIKDAIWKPPVFTPDKVAVKKLSELTKLKTFEMIALVDSVFQLFMEETLASANAISQLQSEQTATQQSLIELLSKKITCVKEYYKAQGEFITMLRSAFDKKDPHMETLKATMDADIEMCNNIVSQRDIENQIATLLLSNQYNESYALELILVYSKCDGNTLEQLKTNIKLDALHHEMTTNVGFWKCVREPSDVFGAVNSSIDKDASTLENPKMAKKYTEQQRTQFTYDAMLTKIKMSEVLTLQKIQRLSQELYSTELELYIHTQQEETSNLCNTDTLCIYAEPMLKQTNLWIDMNQRCDLLRMGAGVSKDANIARKSSIIKELSGLIENFNKSLLNVFDSNKDDEPVESKVKELCNAVALSNEQLVVPTLDAFLKQGWTKNEFIRRLFQLHIVSSVFMYMQNKKRELKDVLNIRYIENVNFWDVYEKQMGILDLLDAVSTILNSELYLTNSGVNSEYCVDGLFDFSETNNSDGVQNLIKALSKTNSLKEKLNVLQKVFKIQFTVFELNYDNDTDIHKMNITGCDLELAKEGEESFDKSDMEKIEYCAFMILYEGKYYIPYNYKNGSFIYKKEDLKKVSIDYVLNQCITEKTIIPSVYSSYQKGGQQEEPANPNSIEQPPVIAQPVPSSNYRIKMENTKESKLSYYIAIDLKLVPGKTLNITDKLKMACEMNADNVRKDLSRLFGFIYVPKPPLLYDTSRKDNTATPAISNTSWMQTTLPELIREKNFSQVVGDDFINLMKSKIHTSEKFKFGFKNLVIASNEYNQILQTHRISTEDLNNLITEARYLPVSGGKQTKRRRKRSSKATRKVRV